jgi:hypothetical protein
MPSVAGRSTHVDRTEIARRMQRQADAARADVGEMEIDNSVSTNQRWTLDSKWVTFECGCVAERCLFVFGARRFDPIIFRGLPQQAVYEKVCDFHAPSMNVYVSFGRFKDFGQWKRHRRSILMGRTRS